MRAFTIDLEVRSPLSLKQSSYRRYAQHPDTGVLCMATQHLHEAEAQSHLPEGLCPVYRPGHKCPDVIVQAILNGDPIYAHNKQFDSTVWAEHCVKRLGWPPIPESQWRCTMAICSYYALPRKLELAGKALNLPLQKDMQGNSLMLALCKPRRPKLSDIVEELERRLAAPGAAVPGKKELLQMAREAKKSDDFISQMPLLWTEDPEKLRRVAEYCRTDVAVQVALLRTLGPLPEDRLLDWQLDQRINARGIHVDVPSLLTAQILIEREMERANRVVQSMSVDTTGRSAITTVGQRDKIMEFARRHGVDMLSLTADDVETVLSRDDLPFAVREVLEQRASAGKASIKKVLSLLHNVDADSRARDAIVWHKASTGRFAGRAWQPHNFPRECMKEEEAVRFHQAIATQSDPVGYLSPESRVGFFDILSTAMRSFLIASPGKRLLVSDFAAIESRVLAWLAGCRLLLEEYHQKKDVYCSFASRFYERPIEVVNGVKPPERQLGKVAVLGLGYQMGADTFIETAKATPGVPDLSEMVTVTRMNPWKRVMETVDITKGKVAVNLFRSTYPEIPQLWSSLQEAFIQSVESRTVVPCGRVSIGTTPDGSWSWILLPSGRALWFRDPRVDMVPHRFNRKKMHAQLSYMTLDDNSSKWVRRSSYGGLLAENVTQAVAADVLIAAMHRIDARPEYPVLLTVHDEVLSETDNGSREEFHSLMEVVPEWGGGLPIEAETRECYRYGK